MSSSSHDYDVFLCHNSNDKPAIRNINEALRQEYGLRTYLDESAIVASEEWERSVQEALSRSKACAIVVGAHGWGPYQLRSEAKPALARAAQDPDFRAIPVLLPGAVPAELLDLREFFEKTHWVDFRGADELLAIRSLASAIRGENPFPEGRPRLTPMRIAFDSIRWEVSSRKDTSVLYFGKLLREALALMAESPAEFKDVARDFLAASKRRQNEELGSNLAAHAGALFNNPGQRELAANLALEAASRFPTPEAHAVLRSIRTMLPWVGARFNHPAPVTALAVDSSKGIATGCKDGSVAFWDGRRLALARTKHGGAVRSAVFAPDGAWLATGSDDGSVIVWDPDKAEPRLHLTHGHPVTKLEVRSGPHGTLLLIASVWPGHSGNMGLWNTAEFTEMWTCGMIMDAALDATGTRVVLAWGDHVAIRGALGGALEASHPLGATVIAVAAHPTHPIIAASTFTRQIWMGKAGPDAIEMHPLGDSVLPSSLIRFSPSGHWLAALGDDSQVRVWNVATQQVGLYPYEGLVGVDFGFSPRDTYLSVLSPERKSITFWHLPLRRQVCVLEYENPSGAVFRDDEAMVMAASAGTVAEMIELPRPDEALWSVGLGYPNALTFSSDGHWLAWTGRRMEADLRIGPRGLTVLLADTAAVAFSVKLPDSSDQGTVESVFDPEGRQIAAFADGGVRIWEVESGTELATTPLPDWARPPASRAVSDLIEKPQIAEACKQRGLVSALASPEGKWLAVHHGAQLISVWETISATQTISFSAGAAVTSMAFSPSGEVFATGDDYGGISVWHTSGTALAQFKHTEPIMRLSFSPNGYYLAAGSADGGVRMWIVAADVLAAQIRPRLKRGLSRKEWVCYLGDEPQPGVAEKDEGSSEAFAAGR